MERFTKDYSLDGHPIRDNVLGESINKEEAITALNYQAETIERLKNGMKGDYDLDQWLDWATSKKHMMETIERLTHNQAEYERLITDLAIEIEYDAKAPSLCDLVAAVGFDRRQSLKTIERLKAAIKYSSDYLDENALNSIGSGSKAHRELKDALNKLEAGEL